LPGAARDFASWVCTKDGHRLVDRIREQLGIDLCD